MVDVLHGNFLCFQAAFQLGNNVSVMRHLKIEAGSDGLTYILYSAPIGNDKPVESPFLFQYLLEQKWIFRAPNGIHFIVSAHNTCGLCPFHGDFKAL